MVKDLQKSTEKTSLFAWKRQMTPGMKSDIDTKYGSMRWL